MQCLFCVLIVLFLQNVSAIQRIAFPEVSRYKIVGIFEGGENVQDTEREGAFNMSDKLETTFVYPTRKDSYSVWRELCKNQEEQIVAIFGPQDPISDAAVRDQCNIVQIPHLQATWQPYDPNLPRVNYEDTKPQEPDNVQEKDAENPEKDEDESEDEGMEDEIAEDEEEGAAESPQAEIEYKNISINYYPDSDDIAIAHAKLLKKYGWTKFAAFYEDDFGLLRIQKIIAEHSTNYPILVKKLDPDGPNQENFKVLIDIKADRILLDCHADRIPSYMDLASEMKIVDHYHHFIFVSLDASRHATKLLKLPSNTTWLSMSEYNKLSNPQNSLASKIEMWGIKRVTDCQLESLLLVDMNNHLQKALENVEKTVEDFEPPDFSICQNKGNDLNPWKHGAALQNEILNYKFPIGETGNIQFDLNGKRVNYTLFVNEIHMGKLHTMGEWREQSGEIEESITDRKNSPESTSIEFRIISRRAKPYFYEREPCNPDKENCTSCDMEKFEGFVVDLVCEMFKVMREVYNLSYTYKFIHEEDKKYGSYDEEKKKWTGLIGDLLDKKADLAVCDLTITQERKEVVDFSVPFMNLGISILYTADQKVEPNTFSFLNPYTVEVWMYIATAYCLVSLVLFVCARISPADWENPQPCDKDPEELENIWNFKNCTWLTMGSIMTQGCDILPKAFGTRWVCGMWWFFAVIICQTYIAQLSASMTASLASEPINNVEDLVKQNKILYGALAGGSTMSFFKNSNVKIYQQVYATLSANEALLVQSNDEGEHRVLRTPNKYAVFMESTSIEFKLMRNCQLKKIGGLLDSKDYGIAMPANSPFRTDINRAILMLKEKTIIDKIKDKWWKEKYDAKECPTITDEQEGDLEWENLKGAFIVLIGGMFFCLFITAAEFMDEVRNIVVREQVTHKEAFLKELKASLNFFQLQKPVLRNPSRAPSVASDKSQLSAKQDRRALAMENFMDMEKMGL